MSKHLAYLGILFIIISISTSCQQANNRTDVNIEIDQKVNKLLNTMTLEEKVGQMTQVTLSVLTKGDNIYESDEPVSLDAERMRIAFSKYKLGSVLNTANTKAFSLDWWNKIINEIQETAIAETGIPVIYGIDAIHGTTYTAGSTLFPQEINQGASFNPDLVKELNELSAYEMRAANIPWNFSPVLDMGRDARDPRLWETYGEDVYLVSQMGAAAVQGLQGDNIRIDKYHGAACLKHFLAYNSNSGKDRNPLEISARELLETHATSFQKSIDAGAKSIMISSGIINGVPVHSNKHILTQLLRNEMGFKGVLVTDWADIENLYNRDKVAQSEKEAVKMAINAGVDMSMVPYNFKFCDYLIELVHEGEVSMSRIDEATSRILHLKYELGLFNEANTQAKDYPKFASQEFAAKAQKMAEESITLLKNDNDILPLAKSAKVLVCGPNANSLRAMNGGWSYSWQGEKAFEFTSQYSSFLKAIENKVGKDQVKYYEGIAYDNEGKYYEEEKYDLSKITKLAKDIDYILLFLGENSYTEKPGDLHDLYISSKQEELAKIAATTGKPIILVLNEGRPRIISKFEKDMDAIIQTYLPGNYGGIALADILFGDINPSGKLPYSYPMFPNSLLTYDYKPAEKQEKLIGAYDYESDVAVQFEFGAGLSYTSFEYSNLEISTKELQANGEIEISLDIKNTGERSGKEVTLLYISDHYASITPANKKLKRFEKVSLNPEETKRVEFSISADDLSFYNAHNQRISEKGSFTISIGGLKADFVLVDDVLFEEASSL